MDKPLSDHIEPDDKDSVYGEKAGVLRSYPVLPVSKVKEAVEKEEELIDRWERGEIDQLEFWKERTKIFGRFE